MSAGAGQGHVLALSGGVGGAKLAAGLAAVLPPERLTIVVNTGDDFEHFGLTVCPDIDSVVYALAGLNDTVRGWGMAGESWQAMAALRALGEEDWFNLGDRDLGMHLARSHRLRSGETLSAVTARLARHLGIVHPVAPMSDEPVRTEVEVESAGGAYEWTEFQRWFVGEQCRPALRGIRFAGAGQARMSPVLARALARPDLGALVICPSNPLLSVDPILAVPGVAEAIAGLAVPRVAVSPLIGGQAVKGPLAKLLAERGQGVDNMAIARHYGALLSHLVIDRGDADDAVALHRDGLCVTVAETMMRGAETRAALARTVLAATGVTAGGD